MEEIIKDLISLLKDFQGLIGVLFGFWIASKISKKERKQKDKITESERIDRYRLSAINERLEKHQKAYEIWYNISLSIHSKESIQISNNARDFWIKNCLYLTPKCREAFDNMIHQYSNYEIQRDIWKDAKGEEKKERSRELLVSLSKIISVGRIIQEEVDNSYTEPDTIKEIRKTEEDKIDKSD